MSLTPSTMTELGTTTPDFQLPDTGGNVVSLADFAPYRGLLVIFMCNHCPYVKHIREGLAAFARRNEPRGLAVVGINANDASTHPADSLEKMAEEVQTVGYTFPYLHDESQEVAKAFQARCTPDLFLYNEDRRLVYRGQFDDSRPGNDIEVNGEDIQSAVDAVLEGRGVPHDQKSSVGCSIKWKRGNEPY
ncbi:MAG: redoxin domain-containing protein [Gammaproteobacteria bacterium]|nr:redoxin domain-containing protein [Gammaproteobacteria bacterium]